jgi:hypothetical protein
MTYDIFLNLIEKTKLPPFFNPNGIYKSSNAQKIPQFLGGSQLKNTIYEYWI